ncbi:MAG: carboxypeptidase M32 [Alphaproteobacteria bacterium]|nr:carboxypeptidase M32 [Alphaproteobacteria bacterium]
MSAAYSELEGRFRRAALLGESIGMLSWDQSVMMPAGGAAARGEQIAALAVIRHSMMTDPALPDLLDAAADEDLDDWQSANLREMRRDWAHAAAVPSDLVEAMSRASSACETVWRGARADADFAAILPTFAEVLTLTKQVGAAKADALGCDLYDALLDAFEPDGRCATIDPIFDSYAAFLPDFLDDVMTRQTRRPTPELPPGPFPIAAQRALVRRMAETVGLEFGTARLDESLHPFSGGIPEDSRITTRYDEADFTLAMMGVLHETGHAMYERARPAAWRRQPVGEARGMTVHESQSLLVEMQVCRSRAFLGWAAPVMRDAFRGSGETWDAENLYRLATRVTPGFIRVDADEVTYPAHVILRYRLERAMLAGDLAIADLPGAWNEGLQGLLGVTPPDDRRGCLQDIHWYDGAWGYFPTYTLGAMAAAQIFTAAVQADTDIPAGIAQGDFRPLMTWLAENIHGKGSLMSTGALIESATGRPFDDSAFKAHLRRRYLED